MKTIKSSKLRLKIKRHFHIRRRVSGTQDIPRLAVFKSNKNLYAQIIDDVKRVTLVAISTAKIEKENKDSKNGKVDKAFIAGEKLAQMAAAKKIKSVVFDRGGYRYHGRVKAIAEGARKGGLNF